MNPKIKKEDKKDISISIALAITFILASVFVSSLVSAEFWGCFERAEKINFCNPATPDRTCGSSNGCLFCMSSFNEEENCYNQGSHNRCNSITPDCSIGFDGETTLDAEPPVLEILSPIQNEIYDSRTVLLDLLVNERSDIRYFNSDNLEGRGTRVCRNCFSYDRRKSFKEGLNSLTFKATDVVGNEDFFDISFVVDSKKPRFSRITPRRGLASGNFQVQFVEENPESLIINYGNNDLGISSRFIDLNSECEYGLRGRAECNFFIDLTEFHNQEIEFWFKLIDIAGRTELSRKTTLLVDAIPPVINSIETEIDGRRVTFTIDVEEENLKSIKYQDLSSSRLRERRLCSRLKDNICTRRITLREGSHSLLIIAEDKAGNSVHELVNIDIVT